MSAIAKKLDDDNLDIPLFLHRPLTPAIQARIDQQTNEGQPRLPPAEELCCETCGWGDVELFGYRRGNGWPWFCAAHRPGKFYADKRLSAPDSGGDHE
jgi:hypothetical protein